MDLASDEINKLSTLDEGGLLAPLQARLDKLTTDIMQSNWKDPLELGPDPGLLSRPFYFYGSYVALTTDQIVQLKEQDLSRYYKCVVGDISVANEQLKGEIDFLKGLSIEYKDEKECLEAALTQVSK